MASLAERVRPTTFEKMVGNKPTISSIQAILKKRTLPKSWLFVGPSGVGKTTIARILAKRFGAIGSGVREINTADIRGIDGVRDIIGENMYSSIDSKIVVYILDECHQLTKDAQNALLKTLEEPPNHVYFILCTTDGSKLINTIRTRCVEFRFAKVSDDDILKLLCAVAEKEDINIDSSLIARVVLYASGSPRMALNLLEKCNAATTEEEVKDLTKGMLLGAEGVGEAEFGIARELFGCMVKQPWPKVGELLDKKLFSGDVNTDGVIMGLKNIMGKILRTKGGIKYANAILMLEDLKDIYGNAGYTAVLYRCFNVLRSK